MTRLAFLEQVEPNLAHRIKKLLLALHLLGEASAASMGDGSSAPKKGSKPPRDPDSLYEEYLERFRYVAPDAGELEAICILAEMELEVAKGGAKRADEADNNNRIAIQQGRTEANDIGLLIDHRQGIHCAVLSVQHHWPLSWIKAQRLRHSQEPIHGVPRENFRAMAEAERREAVQNHQREGLSVRETAIKLGVSVGTVQRYRERQEAA